MGIELQFLSFLQSLHTSVLDQIMIAFTRLGDGGVFWIILALFLLLNKKTRRSGLVLFAALIFSFLITNAILKPLVARVRPYDVLPSLRLLVPRQHDFSFPSGHSSLSFAAAMALWGCNRSYGWAAWPMAAIIAISRLYLSLHYPSDVIAGIVIGIACGALALYLYGLYHKKRSKG